MKNDELTDYLFIVILRYKVPLEQIEGFRSAHLEFLKNYYAKNLFLLSGPQVPRSGGIIIAKCDDKAVLEKILSTDPFAQNDLAAYEIIEFKPTKRNNALESIFVDLKDNDHNSILEEIKSREPIFHHPEIFGKTEQDIENQMCDEFFEVGASGNIYTKQDVIETLQKRYNDQNYKDIWETSHFKLTQIAEDNYLLSYILIQNKTRVTKRSTIWRKVQDSWKILHHQGTIIKNNISIV